MKPHRTFVHPERIPGTSRQRVVSTTGKELHRQNVYMPAESWESLEMLARMYSTSGSQVIGNLIEIAVKFHKQ